MVLHPQPEAILTVIVPRDYIDRRPTAYIISDCTRYFLFARTGDVTDLWVTSTSPLDVDSY